MAPDAEIVRAVLGGEREAFAALVARYERGAWMMARRVLRDDHAAADAAQEAFLQAYRRLGELRTPECFGAWLMRIARREAIRQARRNARRPDRSLGDRNGDSPDDPVVMAAGESRLAEDCEEILAALGRLPQHERVAVVLRYLDGYSMVEVAAALGRPLNTVTKQLSRAIARLKGLLREVAS
jgi:RNA polymerase sigma-70 factor (ECF subfamily)